MDNTQNSAANGSSLAINNSHSTPITEQVHNQSTLPINNPLNQLQELERLNAELLQQREILANIQANANGFLHLQNEVLNENAALNIEDANLRLNNQARRNNFNFNPSMQFPNNQQNVVNRNRLNNPVPFITAITNVPDFSGQPQTLQAFSKVLKDILEDYGPGCEKFILNSIPRRLKGRAYDAYGGIAPNYTSLDEFLQDLKLSFSGITDADTIKLEMRQIEQNIGEPVADYALRVQNLEQALHAI